MLFHSLETAPQIPVRPLDKASEMPFPADCGTATQASFESRVLHRTVDQQPVFIVSAKGSYLYTEDGRKILDGCGGAAVVSVGHCNERIIKAIAEQVSLPFLTAHNVPDDDCLISAQWSFREPASRGFSYYANQELWNGKGTFQLRRNGTRECACHR